jgi:adenylate cyclase
VAPQPRSADDDASLAGMGRAIAAQRARRGLSQDQLAAEVELERPELEAIEAGELDADWGTLRALAYALEVPLRDLIEEAEALAPAPGDEERGEPSRGRRLAAAARRLNSNPKLVELARRTRRQTLGGDRFDRLATARGRPSDMAVQRLVGIRGEEHGFVGELGLSALQAWQRLAESQDRGRGTVDVAILFTDLVGFSSWSLEAGDRAALDLLRQVSEAIEPPVVDHHGEVVKRLGDGLMAVFWDAASAVEVAFEAEARIAAVEVAGYRPRLRTGIHLGRPRKLGGDYFGVDVNIAARLSEAAKPGELLVSDRVTEKLPPGTVRAKKRRFSAKGAPKGLTAYALAPYER